MFFITQFAYADENLCNKGQFNKVDLSKISNERTKYDFVTQALTVTMPAGIVDSSSGISKKIPFKVSYKEACLKYNFKFGQNFDFSAGLPGGPLKQTGKVIGFSGGENSTGGVDDQNYKNRGWSTRINWREGGLLNLYTYHQNQKTVFGDDLPFNKKIVIATPGQTYHAEMYVKMNDIGKNNGLIILWINGEKVADYYDIEFRNSMPNSGIINEIRFSVFIGGGDSNWSHPNDENITISDMTFTGIK
jgi:hypothetical protein